MTSRRGFLAAASGAILAAFPLRAFAAQDHGQHSPAADATADGHEPTLFLVGLGAVAGAPAILGAVIGAVIGAAVDNAALSAVLLGVGVGAITQVITQISPALRDHTGRVLDPPSSAGWPPA